MRYGHAAFLAQKPEWLTEAWAEVAADIDEEAVAP